MKKTTFFFLLPVVFIVFSVSIGAFFLNAPLNDDWAYASAVLHFTKDGKMILCDWASATQIIHIIWGSAFAKIFGFSHNILRLSTVITAICSIFIFQRILARFKIPPERTLIISSIYALNPLFLILANSFMTDITYLFWMEISILFLLKYLDSEKTSFLWWTSFFSSMAYLTRQLGILLPFATSCVLAGEIKKKPSLLAAIWLFPAASLLGYGYWFNNIHGQTWASVNYVLSSTLKHIGEPLSFARDIFTRFSGSMIESGFFLFPAFLPFIPSFRKNWIKNSACKNIAVVFFTSLIFFAAYALITGNIPYFENNIGKWGLGVLTVGQAQYKESAFFSSTYFWTAATIVGVSSSAALVPIAREFIRRTGKKGVFLATLCGAHFLMSASGAKYFDRYLLTLFPFLLVASAASHPFLRHSLKTACTSIFLMLLIVWMGMFDYFSWNKAKWDIAEKGANLLQINKEEIINGFDYNAWLSYEKNMVYLKNLKPLKMIGEWEWQKMINYKALTSFGRRYPFKEGLVLKYATPLSPQKGKIFLLLNPENENLP